MDTQIKLLTGVSEKTGKNWYMCNISIGKCVFEAIFITELQFDYLKSIEGKTSKTDEFGNEIPFES